MNIIEILKFGTLLALFIVPVFFPVRRRRRGIRLPRHYYDTRGAHYVINKNGRLEEITHDNLSNPSE